MSGLLALMFTLLQAPPTDHRTIESWTCTAKMQLDRNVSGLMQMLVYPDGSRRQLSFFVNWSAEPGHMAEQQLSWIGIPLEAIHLWKPDRIGFSVSTERTDEQGAVTFDSAAFGRISEAARGKVRSLRPTFRSTWVSVEDAHLVDRLWSSWPWEARLWDRNGATLGVQAILLPGPKDARAMFTRLRAELDRYASDRERNCRANEVDEWDLMQQVI